MDAVSSLFPPINSPQRLAALKSDNLFTRLI